MDWAWAILFNGLLGGVGYGLARFALGQPPGLPRGLAAAVLAWTWATLGMLALGTAGAIGRGPLLGWAAAGLVIVALAAVVRRGLAAEQAPRKPAAPRDWTATLALGLIIWAANRLFAWSLLLPVKVVSDGPIYHLYFAARWWKAGRIFPIASVFGENAATYFPANGDVWFAWLMTTWGGDRLARVGQAPFLLMAAAASFGLARRLGVGASAALIAVGWFVSTRSLLTMSFEANADTIFVAGYLAATFFGLRYALGDGGAGELLLAGLAAGGAWGTRPTATAFIPPLLGLGILVILGRTGRSAPGKLAHVAALLGSSLVLSGYWFGRNAWWTGNPLYPLHIEAFGRVWLPGWYGPEAMRRSQFYLPLQNGRALAVMVARVFDPRLLPVWLAALAGAWRLGRPARALDWWVWGLAGLAVLNGAIYWLAIPYRTQERFLLQAPGLAAIPLGRLLDRARALRVLGLALLAVYLLTPLDWPLNLAGTTALEGPADATFDARTSLIRLPVTPEDLRSLTHFPSQIAVYHWVQLSLGPASLAVAWSWRVARQGRLAATRAVLASLALTTLAGANDWFVGGGRLMKFPTYREYQLAWTALERLRGRPGLRIAYAGMNLPYYLMGNDLRNDVRYVNIDDHRDWLMHDYHRTAAGRGEPTTWDSPRPGWDRIRPAYDAWLANLRAERIDLLVVAKANPIDGPFNLADGEGFPIERRWADAHPETFRPVYGVAEGDPQMKIYRVASPAEEPAPGPAHG